MLQYCYSLRFVWCWAKFFSTGPLGFLLRVWKTYVALSPSFSFLEVMNYVTAVLCFVLACLWSYFMISRQALVITFARQEKHDLKSLQSDVSIELYTTYPVTTRRHCIWLDFLVILLGLHNLLLLYAIVTLMKSTILLARYAVYLLDVYLGYDTKGMAALFSWPRASRQRTR